MLTVLSIMLVVVPITHPSQITMVQIMFLHRRSQGTLIGNVYVVEVRAGSGVETG